MKRLFDNPLTRNEKIGKTPMVSEELKINDSYRGRQPQFKDTLVNGLLAGQRNGSATMKHDDLRPPPTTRQVSTRPARPTRASAPVYDLQMLRDVKKVPKHSIDVGLGPRWDK